MIPKHPSERQIVLLPFPFSVIRKHQEGFVCTSFCKWLMRNPFGITYSQYYTFTHKWSGNQAVCPQETDLVSLTCVLTSITLSFHLPPFLQAAIWHPSWLISSFGFYVYNNYSPPLVLGPQYLHHVRDSVMNHHTQIMLIICLPLLHVNGRWGYFSTPATQEKDSKWTSTTR